MIVSNAVEADSCSFDQGLDSAPLESITENPAAPPDAEADFSIHQICWQILKKSSHHRFLADRARQFVNLWSRTLAADQVVLVCQQQGKSKVIAVSGAVTFDANSESIQQLEQLSSTQGKSVDPEFWSASRQIGKSQASLIETYARTNGFRSAALIPLIPSGKDSPIGHVLTFSSAAALHEEQILQFSSELFPVMSDQILTWQRAERNRVSRFFAKAKKYLVGSKRKLWLMAAFLFVAILLFPVPYKVNCNSSLEPTTRRYVASPFAGRLKEIFVEPGSSVSRDQVLAIIDGDEIQWKLDATLAEFGREQEKYNAALQEGRVSDAHVASLEMKKLQHDIQFFREKISNLEIKSPVDGIVVSGDLEKSKGTPLEKGQTLFEIGPLEFLNIQIEVPESEVRFIKPHQTVEIRFQAFPLKSFSAQVERIYPRAEIKDDQVVFVALAKLSNPGRLLRPGMKGQVKINTGSSTIGWNLFHRPTEKFRSFIGF